MATDTRIHMVRDLRSGRLRARTVSARLVGEEALRIGRIQIEHGGSVPNSYKYPAWTEAVLAVPVEIDGQRHVALYAAQLAANKVTHGGAAEACLPGTRPVFDRRFGATARQIATDEALLRAAEDLARILSRPVAGGGGLAGGARYLKAYLEAREPGRLAILLFPPGVTMEDAGCDRVASLFAGAYMPTLPGGVIDRLSGLGVEIAVGPEAAPKALRRAAAHLWSLDAFAEDYLGVNARLGGERCVTVREYAMHAWFGDGLLRDALRRHLSHKDGVRMYGDTAFRDDNLPDILCLPVVDIARFELSRQPRLFVPCRLHGDWCRGYRHDILPDHTGAVVEDAMSSFHAAARVAVPRHLLDDLRRRPGLDAARAAREIVRLLLGALPEEAWRDGWRPIGFDAVAAAAVAETCEEYEMLARALRGCGSAREVVQRARDASWAVSRALERLHDTE